MGHGLPARCRRILIEPLDPDPSMALRDAAETEAILAEAGVTLPQVHHGFDESCRAVNRRALERGMVSARAWRMSSFCRTGNRPATMRSLSWRRAL